MNYFDSDMSNSTNTVVYFDWKTLIYIYVCGQFRLKRYSNMTSFIGYINNTMIKLTIYFKSHMRSDEQIKHIIPW